MKDASKAQTEAKALREKMVRTFATSDLGDEPTILEHMSLDEAVRTDARIWKEKGGRNVYIEWEHCKGNDARDELVRRIPASYKGNRGKRPKKARSVCFYRCKRKEGCPVELRLDPVDKKLKDQPNHWCLRLRIATIDADGGSLVKVVHNHPLDENTVSPHGIPSEVKLVIDQLIAEHAAHPLGKKLSKFGAKQIREKLEFWQNNRLISEDMPLPDVRQIAVRRRFFQENE